MKISNKIATEIKNYLINLAMVDELDSDMTLLNHDKLAEIIEGVFNSEDEKQNRREEKAGMILYQDSDETLSIAEQIKLIEAHADLSHDNEDDLIDEIDGVSLLEATEFSYTCESFLDTIND